MLGSSIPQHMKYIQPVQWYAYMHMYLHPSISQFRQLLTQMRTLRIEFLMNPAATAAGMRMIYGPLTKFYNTMVSFCTSHVTKMFE